MEEDKTSLAELLLGMNEVIGTQCPAQSRYQINEGARLTLQTDQNVGLCEGQHWSRNTTHQQYLELPALLYLSVFLLFPYWEDTQKKCINFRASA